MRGVERLKLTCLEIASSGGLSEDPLASRQRKGREALASSEKRGYLLFDEYESTVLAQVSNKKSLDINRKRASKLNVETYEEVICPDKLKNS